MRTEPYKKAEVKFNNGRGALLCNTCYTIIAYGFDHEDKYHECKDCAQKQTAPDNKDT